jgi:NADH:ubiquinone oxidoreductase subunit 6 (subunit J)
MPPQFAPTTPVPMDVLRLIRYGIGGGLILVALLLGSMFFWEAWLDADNVTANGARELAEDAYNEPDLEDAVLEDCSDSHSACEEAFVDNWAEFANDVEVGSDDKTSVTPFQVWVGNDGSDDFTYDLGKSLDESDTGGFGDVRLLDRTLILMPIGAVAVIIVSIVYMLSKNTSAKVLPIILIVLGLLLTVYPILWGILSTSDWAGDLEDDFYEGSSDAAGDEYADLFANTIALAYNRTLFQITSGVILVLGMGALVLAFAAKPPQTMPSPYYPPQYPPQNPYAPPPQYQ